MSERAAPGTTPAASTGLRGRIDRYFEVTARGSTLARETRGGLATFFAMAYVVVLNPLIIGTAPDINGDTLGVVQVAAVTALTAGVMCVLMGAISRYPFAIAAGMGLNAFVAYSLAPNMTWPDAMGLLVLEGVILIALVLTGFRTAVFRAIPPDLKIAIAVGVGLFLTLIGFVNAGFVRRIPDAAGTTVPVQLGDGQLAGWPILVFVVGLAVSVALIALRVRGALLIGILIATVLAVVVESVARIGPMVGADGEFNPTGWALTVPAPPTSVGDLVSAPDFSLIGQANPFGAFTTTAVLAVVLLVFTLLLADFFDTMGTMVGIGTQAGLTDQNGNLPRAREVLVVDALGTVAGGGASASVQTVYAESAAGVGDGARTGIAAIVTGALFLVTTLLSPVVRIVPSEAATPVLIIVGFMMLSQVGRINFQDYAIGIPAFLTIVIMPFSYSIADGIGMGFISYAFIRLVQGRPREVHPLLWVVAAAFLVHFSLGPIEAALGL